MTTSFLIVRKWQLNRLRLCLESWEWNIVGVAWDRKGWMQCWLDFNESRFYKTWFCEHLLWRCNEPLLMDLSPGFIKKKPFPTRKDYCKCRLVFDPLSSVTLCVGRWPCFISLSISFWSIEAHTICPTSVTPFRTLFQRHKQHFRHQQRATLSCFNLLSGNLFS